MSSFFSNLFNRNNDPKSIVSFDVLYEVYSHLYHESSRLNFKMKGIHDTVSVALYSIPDSFDHDEGKAEIKKAGFNNAYEILNEVYKKVNIGPLSDEEIKEGLNYYYIHIEFFSKPAPEMKKHLKHVLNNFIVFFCCTNSAETNDFKLLYNNSYFYDYTRGLLELKAVDIKEPTNEIQKIGFKDFEIVLQGICEYLGAEIPATVVKPSTESLIAESTSVEHFQEFLKLISRGEMEEELLESQAQILFEAFEEGVEDYDYDDEFDFFEGVNCWNSDWKFDAEEAEAIVSDLIDQDFKFDYPEETYSHDLFPYIQKELAKQELELMSYDTKGDSYLFFVANKSEVDRILELSELTKIEIDQL